VKRLAIIVAAVAALALPGRAAAGPCGLPDTKPLWIDFGATQLQSQFARPGVIVATTGEGAYPPRCAPPGCRPSSGTCT
jgi:hypothetical protein